MARIVPSLLTKAIGHAYPWALEAADGRAHHDPGLGPDQAPNVGMILALLEALPPELHPEKAEDLLIIEAAKGAMRGAMSSWAGGAHSGLAAQLRSSAVFHGDHPMTAVLKVLRAVPDEAPPPGTSGLQFINDADLRHSLRGDLGTAHRAFGNGEYKASTVLAGSVIEALLLWGFTNLPGGGQQAAIAAVNAQRKTGGRKRLPSSPDEWHLADYIEASAQLGLIKQDTKKATDLTRDFRNLIHPGKAKRTGQACTQSTALIALGAAQRVIEEFQARTW